MSRTMEDKERELQEKRSNALQSLFGIEKGIDEAEEKVDFTSRFLFGDSEGNGGLIDVWDAIYSELSHLVGRTTTNPDLSGGGSSRSTWEDQFEKAVRTQGDGEDGFYPPDDQGVGAEELNEDSPWLNDNGDGGETEGGSVGSALNDVKDAIGEEASENSDGRGPYADEESAEDHRDSSRGSGIRGRRTENSEVYEETEEWYVGQNGIDTPHYFNDPEREDLLSALQSAIDEVEDYHSNYLQEVIDQLSAIADGENGVFEEGGMEDVVDSSNISHLESIQSDFQTHQQSLQDQYDYFSQFTADDDISSQSGYTESEFNSELSNTTDLIDDILSDAADRADEIPSFFGSGIDDRFLKWRTFWIKDLIGKPDGAINEREGLEKARSSTQRQVSKANSALDELFGDRDFYIPNPIVFAAFADPRLDSDDNIVERRTQVIWQGALFIPAYRIYRRTIEIGDYLDGDEQWDDSEDGLAWMIAENEENGAIRTKFRDRDVEVGKIYVYRVRAEDSEGPFDGESSPLPRRDSFDSSSQQSSIYDTAKETAIDRVEEGNRLFFDEEFEEDPPFEGPRFVLVKGAADGDGIYAVKSIDNEKVVLQSNVDSATSVTPVLGITVV